MPEIPELSELRSGNNGSYLDQWGNTILSPTRPGQAATLTEIAEMRIAQIVGPPVSRVEKGRWWASQS